MHHELVKSICSVDNLGRSLESLVVHVASGDALPRLAGAHPWARLFLALQQMCMHMHQLIGLGQMCMYG